MEEREQGPEYSENLWQCLPADRQKDNNRIKYSVYKIRLLKNWTEPGEFAPTISTADLIAIKYAESENDADIKVLNEEYRLLSLVNKKDCNIKYIVSVFRLFDFDTTKPELPFFVMELGERSLGKFLENKELIHTGKDGQYEKDERYYTIRRSLIWLMQMAQALDFLHEKRILHRDLKPDNVLLFDHSTLCKLCDFGNSTDAVKTNRTPYQGTPYYMAPEMRSSTPQPYTHKVDIFSFGIVMHECLCTREPPKQEFVPPDASLFGKEADEKYKFDKLTDIMCRLTKTNPDERPATLMSTLSIELKYLDLDAKTQIPPLTHSVTNMPGLPGSEQLEDNESPSQRSLSRTGTTLYYSVAVEDPGPASDHERTVAVEDPGPASDHERRAVKKTLKGILRQINKKAADHYKKPPNYYINVTNKLLVHLGDPATKPDEFLKVEHIIKSQNRDHEREVEQYCLDPESTHLSWLQGRFSDDPISTLRSMKFSVNMNIENMLPEIEALQL